MSQFAYSAFDANAGKRISAVIEAKSKADAWNKVALNGYRPIEVRPVGSKFITYVGSLFNRVSVTQQLTFYRSMTMFENGRVPRDQSLRALAESAENKAYGRAIARVGKTVENGKDMADGMAAVANFFPGLQIAMTRVADRTNKHAEVFERMSHLLKRDRKIEKDIGGALVYPIITGILSFLVIGALMGFIIPKFRDIYDTMGTALPWQTVLVVNAADAVKNPLYTISFVLACVGINFGWRAAMKVDTFATFMERVFDRTPLVGSLRKKSAVSRFCRLFSVLLESHIPEDEALGIVIGVAGNRALAQALIATKARFEDKGDLPDALRRSEYFPAMVTSYLDTASSSKTSMIPKALRDLSELYDQDVDDAILKLTKIIEPVSIGLLAIVVCGIIIALYLPFLGLLSSVTNTSG